MKENVHHWPLTDKKNVQKTSFYKNLLLSGIWNNK